nr:hypothetical protein [Tanacetum cinerariifolium]
MNIAHRLSYPRYELGVNEFLDFAYRNIQLSSKVPCHCKDCNNYRKHSRPTILRHLMQRGITVSYENWIHHGEPYDDLDDTDDDMPISEESEGDNDMDDDDLDEMLNNIGESREGVNWHSSGESSSTLDKDVKTLRLLLDESHQELFTGYSEAWKHLDRVEPSFASDPCNIRLGLATDGFNPFGNQSNPYIIWPVFVIPYNLPPWKCMKDPYMLMSMALLPSHLWRRDKMNFDGKVDYRIPVAPKFTPKSGNEILNEIDYSFNTRKQPSSSRRMYLIPPVVGTKSVSKRIDMVSRFYKTLIIHYSCCSSTADVAIIILKRREGKNVAAIDSYEIAHYCKKKKKWLARRLLRFWYALLLCTLFKNKLGSEEAAGSGTPAKICFKLLKRVPGHLRGCSTPKKEILAVENLRAIVESEKKKSAALEEKLKEVTVEQDEMKKCKD